MLFLDVWVLTTEAALQGHEWKTLHSNPVRFPAKSVRIMTVKHSPRVTLYMSTLTIAVRCAPDPTSPVMSPFQQVLLLSGISKLSYYDTMHEANWIGSHILFFGSRNATSIIVDQLA